jgi:hypothetical protein
VLTREQRDLAEVIRNRLEATDLLVIGQAGTARQRHDLVRQAARSRTGALLVCGESYQQASRVLVLDDGRTDARDNYLETAAALCRTLSARLVVLAVARSARATRERQQLAAARLAGFQENVDFDAVIGADIRTAVKHVARWRRCPLVIVRQPGLPSWRRWLGDWHTDLLLDAEHNLTCLALSNTVSMNPDHGSAETQRGEWPPASSP